MEIKKKVLDIGCGRWKLPGAIGIDAVKELETLYGKDEFICMNLLDRLPFEDNSVDEVYASHIIEHFKNPKDEIIKEVHRVLRTGAVLRSFYPINSPLDGGEFGHKIMMDENWFEKNVGEWFTVIKKDVFVNKNVDFWGNKVDMPCVYIELKKK